MPAWSALNDGFYGTPYVLPSNISAPESWLARWARIPGLRVDKALMVQLLGAAPGNTVTVQSTRVKQTADPADIMNFGGKRTIETVTEINRATTSADATRLIAILNRLSPLNMPVDKSGNSPVGDPERVV